jgi:NAD(P)-dependent dehydrogenase (short-subunit alcohol dehydrogenase family)
MSDPFRDRIAVVTGGAWGVGFARARARAARGAKLVLADIDEGALEKSARELADAGASVHGVATDVTRRDSLEALAEETFSHFGGAHVLCNNAGIAVLGSVANADAEVWEKSMAVNFWGVVHGIDAFLPRMVEQKQGGNVVNTASMAGLVGMKYLGIYCVTKFAVVGLSESLEREVKPHGIGVHVLCPMIVATNIAANTARALGQEPPEGGVTGLPGGEAPPPGDLVGGVITPEEVGRRVVDGIDRGSLYILTHPEQREILKRRWERQDAVFENF